MATPTIVSLALRAPREDGELVYEDINLDKLSPRARAIAEAIAQTSLHTRTVVWCASRRPRREIIPDAARWWNEEELDKPELRPFSGWAHYPAESALDPYRYLEQEARKIPRDWVIIGSHPQTPVPSYDTAATQPVGWTRDQVLAYLAKAGRVIEPNTWSGYVTRGQAPKPVRYVARTPEWDPDEVRLWQERPEQWRQAQRADD